MNAEKTAPQKIALAAILILLFVDKILCDINANDTKANEVIAIIQQAFVGVPFINAPIDNNDVKKSTLIVSVTFT